MMTNNDAHIERLEKSLHDDFRAMDRERKETLKDPSKDLNDSKKPILSLPYSYYAGFTIVNRRLNGGFGLFH